jgi:uncharacterized membrane-anchored protein YitT (DUF2179 family)
MLTITIGALIAALGYSMFQLPFNLAGGGLSGLAIIVNHFTGWSEGILYLLLNIPLLLLGFFYLGRWQFVINTVFAVFVFSAATDLFAAYLPLILPEQFITHDMLLSAMYAGLVSGIGTGMIYRVGGTLGSTGVIGRVIQIKTGFPLSQAYLYADGAIICLSGLVFGWEIALHAFLMMFLNGLASDFVMEGPSTVRMVMIVTNQPDNVGQALIVGLNRSVTYWNATGGYTGQSRSMLWCTISRSEVNALKKLVSAVDPHAFVVIGDAHQALGAGFPRLKE